MVILAKALSACVESKIDSAFAVVKYVIVFVVILAKALSACVESMIDSAFVEVKCVITL